MTSKSLAGLRPIGMNDLYIKWPSTEIVQMVRLLSNELKYKEVLSDIVHFKGMSVTFAFYKAEKKCCMFVFFLPDQG